VPRRGVVTTADELRVGNLIEYEGKQYTIAGFDVHMRGRAHTTISFDLRDIASGVKMPVRWRPTDKIEVLQMEYKMMLYLYAGDSLLHFMDTETFEQVELPQDIITPTTLALLNENQKYRVSLLNNQVVSIHVPEKSNYQVKRRISDKVVLLENGLELTAPEYIQAGDWVKVSTQHLAFNSRADGPDTEEES
jgi:elongation factor P